MHLTLRMWQCRGLLVLVSTYLWVGPCCCGCSPALARFWLHKALNERTAAREAAAYCQSALCWRHSATELPMSPAGACSKLCIPISAQQVGDSLPEDPLPPGTAWQGILYVDAFRADNRWGRDYTALHRICRNTFVLCPCSFSSAVLICIQSSLKCPTHIEMHRCILTPWCRGQEPGIGITPSYVCQVSSRRTETEICPHYDVLR